VVSRCFCLLLSRQSGLTAINGLLNARRAIIGNRNGRISLGRYANQLDLRQVRECGERLGDIYNDPAEHFFSAIDHPIDVFPFEAQCPLLAHSGHP
jgi:hypothetical protein